MKTNKALVVIDLQNDITKNYKKIIAQVNNAIDRAAESNMHIVYIKHYNLSEKTRTFKPDTKGAEFVPELNVVSENIFEKFKASALKRARRNRSHSLAVNGRSARYARG